MAGLDNGCERCGKYSDGNRFCDHPDCRPEMVDHPSHYGGADNPYEAIKVIDAWQLGFALGNTVKYIARAAHKGSELEDLKKAQWYLNHRIEQLGGAKPKKIAERHWYELAERLMLLTKTESVEAALEFIAGAMRTRGRLELHHAYKNNDERSPYTACGLSIDDSVMCGRDVLISVDCPNCLAWLNPTYRCPFCKSLSFGKRANAEEVFCTCGATVKWPLKHEPPPEQPDPAPPLRGAT